MSEPLVLDLADFDAVGVVSDVVVSLRVHSIEHAVDSAATVSAPEGWHRVIVNCSSTGQVVLRVRFLDLTRSRANNVTKALTERRWVIDEDEDGASLRQPPGTDATAAAFEILGAVSLGGAPADVRTVTAFDSTGAAIDLSVDQPGPG